MDAATFIDRIRGNDFFEQQTSHIEVIPAKEARHADLRDGLHPSVEAALNAQGRRAALHPPGGGHRARARGTVPEHPRVMRDGDGNSPRRGR